MLVDVVVRDGKGRPVTDLVAADFEVLEDGTAQVVAQFAPPSVAAAAAGAPKDAPATGPLAPAPSASSALTERDTIAFVFDRLSTSGRVAAQKAARTYLGKRGVGNTGVFSIESSLVVLQEFTTDQTLVLAAIDALGDRVAHTGGTRMEEGRANLAGRLAANKAQQTLAQMPQPRTAAEGSARAQASIAAIRASVAQAAADAFDRLERDEHGFTTAHALTAIVDALRTVPGRKAIVLFSGGLYRTEGTENRFLSVIHAANRASVAVYAVEAEGLQTSSSESLTGAEIHSVANTSMARQESGLDTGGGAFTRDLERAEDITKFNPRASLQWISEGTGGTFTRDTNDLEGALTRIGSDLRSYYLLGYTPKNERWDGRFRKIAVRTKRKGLEVSARSGYFAVRSAGPVLAHVAPALAVLESGRDPKGVLVFAGATRLPGRRGSGPVQHRRHRAGSRRGPPRGPGEGAAGRHPARPGARGRREGRGRHEPAVRRGQERGHGRPAAASRRLALSGDLHGGSGRLRRFGRRFWRAGGRGPNGVRGEGWHAAAGLRAGGHR